MSQRKAPLPRLTAMRTLMLIAAIAAGILAAGCGSAAAPKPAPVRSSFSPVTAVSSQTTQQAVLAWWASGGKADFAALISALGAASTAGKSGNMAEFATACQQFGHAITTLQSAGPVPDPTSQMWLARALAGYSTGAADCQAGAQADNAALLQQADAAIVAGTADLGQATAALTKLSA